MRVGNREIISSGSVVTQQGDESIELSYQDLKFELHFATDGGEMRANIKGAGKSAAITFFNFDNALGTAWEAKLGTLTGGRTLHFACFIHVIGKKGAQNRLVSYTLSAES